MLCSPLKTKPKIAYVVVFIQSGESRLRRIKFRVAGSIPALTTNIKLKKIPCECRLI